MSSTNERTEGEGEVEEVGGLGEVLPEPLQPLWRPIERVQRFRHTHGNTYVAVLEAVIAIVLIGGYVWWLYLFLVV